jgi:hypothetical protein
MNPTTVYNEPNFVHDRGLGISLVYCFFKTPVSLYCKRSDVEEFYETSELKFHPKVP